MMGFHFNYIFLQLKLKATHYALKIFPKTEEEQRSLELDEQIK